MNSVRGVNVVWLLALVTCASGCGGMIHFARAGAGGRAPAQGGRYDGDECAPYQADDAGLHSETPAAKSLAWTYDDQHLRSLRGVRLPGSSERDSAILLTCIDETSHVGNDGTTAIIADHADFDDRHFDHVRAGVMVLECALDPECGVHESVEELGILVGYARRIDPAAAGAALARTGVSEGLRSAFVAKLQWARGELDHRAQAYSPRGKAIWIDVPEQVWTERHAYFVKWAKLYARLDPLIAAAQQQRDAHALAVQIRKLRGTYLDACRVEGCLFTPFVWDATRALALLAVREHQPTEVLAESQLIDDRRLQAQQFSRAVFLATFATAKREQQARKRYDSAKTSGASEAALTAMFGPVPPLQVDADTVALILGDQKVADLSAALDRDRFRIAGGKVRSIEHHGDRATVSFSDDVIEWDDADCHDTNQIDSISSDGKVNYRRTCTNYRPQKSRRKVEPIDVPAEEAVLLRAGDLVFAWVTGAPLRGSVFEVERDKHIVQIRGHWLRAPEPRE